MAVAGIISMLANSAQAATFYYFRGGATAQTTAQTPPPPNNNGTFAILVDGPAVAARGDSYVATTYTYNNVGSVTYSLQSGALPPGISINPSTGSITGTPTTNGQSQATIQALDSATNGIATATLTVDVVDPFSISGNPATSIATNAPYSTTFFLAGGSAPYSMSTTALPPGLSFAYTGGASQGTISGTATTAGAYSITVTGRDANGLSASYPFSLNVMGALAVAGTPPATGNVGTPYTGSITASGGSGSGYTYALAAGSLPAGITLKSATGIISGTPTLAQSKTGIRVKVTDSAGGTATSASFSITIGAALPLAISGNPPNTVEEGFTYYTQWTASGGTAPYTFSLTGALPSGLGWDPVGARISGAPDAGSAGSYPLTIKVADSASHTATAPYTLTVTAPAAPQLVLSGTPAASAYLEQPYSAQFSASGGVGGYVYSISSGTLPPGISLNSSSGLLAGTPTVLGTYPNIVVRVTDSSNTAVASTPFGIAVTDSTPLSISWTPKTQWTVGDTLSTVVTATGGKPPLTYSSTGTLPPGVTLDPSSGALSGQLTQGGLFGPVSIGVTDGVRTATTTAATFNVSWTPVVVSGNPPNATSEGSVYSAQFTASGGAGGYVWALATGTLPAGVSLDPASGLLSGTLSAGSNGTYPNISVKATDSAGNSAQSTPFSLKVSKPLAIASNPATFIVAGTPYNVSFFLSGGSSPYTFSETGTPPGLSFIASGGVDTLSGTATTAGTYPITVTGKDSTGSSVAYSYTLTVAPKLMVSGSPALTVTVGTPYSAQFVASGGVGAPYVYNVATGTLPPGLSFDPSSGLLSGSPSAAGTYPGLSIGVTDVGGLTATSAVFSIEVDPAVSGLTISWSPNLTYTDGDNIFTALTVSGGTGNYHFSYSGTLPPEVSQNGDDAGPYSGALVGVMTPPGTYGPITVTVSDGVSTATTTPATFVVNPAVVPAITVVGPYVPGSSDTSTQPDSPVAGANYAGQLSASGGNGGPYTYTLILGSDKLPPGLVLNQTTGVIAGTVNLSASGYYGPIQVRATDSAGNFGLSGSFYISVQPALSVDIASRQAGREGVPFQSYYLANDGTAYFNNPPNVNGGDGNYVWSISGTLPDGLGIDTYGNIVGTPASGTAGAYPGLAYTVQDGTGASVTSNPFTLKIDPPPPPPAIAVSYTSFSSPYQVGQYFLTNLSATGGDGGPYTFAIQETLPAGFAFDGRGLSATAAASNVGTWTFTATATDSHGNVGSTSFQVVFVYAPMQLNGGGTVTVNVGDNIQSALSPAQYTFHAIGGSGSYTFTIISGSLPPGLVLGGADASNIYLSGTVGASASGLYSNIVVQATDSVGNTATANPFSIFVTAPGPLTIAGNPPTVGYVGQLYQTQFFASGGSGTGYIFTGVNFPSPNLRIDASTGVVQGSLIPGTYSNLQVQVSDSLGNTTLSLPWTITVPNALSLSIPSPIKGKIGQPIDPVQAVASGGSGTGYKYAMWDFGAALPAGLTFNATTGQITGTPQEAASGSGYRGQVTDSANNFVVSNYFEIDIQAPLVFVGTPDPDAYVGVDYSATAPKASGGDNMPWLFTYASVGAALPPGLTVNPRNGLISGNPTAGGVYAGIQLQVTDSSGNTGTSAVFSITVHQLNTTQPVIAWFQSNGFVNGAPSQQPGNQFSIQTIATGVNTPVTLQVGAAGGKSHTYNYTITPGYGGANISVSPSGVFSATFQSAGTYRVSARATDPVSGMYGDTPPAVVQVTDLAISAGADLTVMGGQDVLITTQTTGGTAPFKYRKGGGMLPSGVYVDPADGYVKGTLQGQGAQGGVFQFSVSVTDANGLTADTGMMSIGVWGAMGCVLVGIGPYGVLGQGPAVVGTGIEPSPNYPDHSGLGPNIVVNSPMIYGPGYYSFPIKAGWIDIPFEKASCLDSAFTVRFVDALDVFSPGLRYGVAGGSFTYQLQTTGGGGYNWYTASPLPSGLHIDHDSGLISGTIAPTAAGSYDVIVTAMDQYGEFVQQVMQIAVAQGN
jgi:hypothetical protein